MKTAEGFELQADTRACQFGFYCLILAGARSGTPPLPNCCFAAVKKSLLLLQNSRAGSNERRGPIRLIIRAQPYYLKSCFFLYIAVL
jgi:hypothetical protein